MFMIFVTLACWACASCLLLYLKKFQSSPLLQKSRLPAAVSTNSDDNKHRSVNISPSVPKVARYLLTLLGKISAANHKVIIFVTYNNRLVYIHCVWIKSGPILL